MKRNLIAALVSMLFLASPAYAAEYANPGLLATPKMVQDNIAKPDWVVIDCRDKAAYDKEHISGAISLGDSCSKALRDTTSRVKKTAELEGLLGGAGISQNMHIVVYADAAGILSASVGFWVLEYLGHNNVHFLNGGIEGYKAAGGKVDNVEVKKAAWAAYKASVVSSRIAASSEMLGHANIALGKAAGTDVNIVDSRTSGENMGTDIRALRGGAIPGTDVNVPHTNTYDRTTGAIKSMDELTALFGKLDKSKRTIPYCQTGTRSTLLYLEMRLMGFADPANYDDSWIVWGSNVNYPVINENWFDFGTVGASKSNAWDTAVSGVAALKKDVEAGKVTDAALKKDVEAVKNTAEEAKKTADEVKAVGKGLCGPSALVAIALLPLAGYFLRRRN